MGPLSNPEVATFAVLAVALFLFVSEKLRADMTALGIPVALGLLGVLTPSEATEGFGHPAVITVAALFIVCRALVDSGSVSALGGLLQRIAAGGQRRAMIGLVLFAVVPSMLINNTLVVVVFLPVALQLANDLKVPPSKLLMPLSFAAIFGGCCTSIGTSTTVLVSAEVAKIKALRGPGLGFFEPGLFGIVIVIASVAFLVVIGHRLLPVRRTVTTSRGSRRSEYVTEVMIAPGSPLAGKTLRRAVLQPHPDLRVIEIVRGSEIIWPEDAELVLQEHDLLFIRGPATDVVRIGTRGGAELLPELRGAHVRTRDVTLAELVVARNSPLVGLTVTAAMERSLPGSSIMAVQRRGAHLRTGIADLVLEDGDELLVQTEEDHVADLRESDDFVLLEGIHEQVALKRRASLVLGVTLAVILLASLEVADIAFLAAGAAAVLVITGCLTPKKAYRSLDMPTLILMGGTIAMGTGMESSGAAETVAGLIFEATGTVVGPEFGAYGALAAVWILANVLTCLISNVAAAAIVLPIALNTAAEMGVSDRPFIMTVVYAASLGLATPVGYHTNILVWNPGGYRFGDYTRVGLPLQVVLFALGVWLVPLLYPF